MIRILIKQQHVDFKDANSAKEWAKKVLDSGVLFLDINETNEVSNDN